MSVDEENGDEGELLVITTGGTIDKDYPTKDGYAFVFPRRIRRREDHRIAAALWLAHRQIRGGLQEGFDGHG